MSKANMVVPVAITKKKIMFVRNAERLCLIMCLNFVVVGEIADVKGCLSNLVYAISVGTD